MTDTATTIATIRDEVAATRARIAAAVADDPDAVKLLDRALPADWGDFPLACVWLLSNAARFATSGDGFGADMAEEWLDRLVDKGGEPRERPLPNTVALLLLRWLADVDNAIDDNPGRHDECVRIGARWCDGNYRELFRQAINA